MFTRGKGLFDSEVQTPTNTHSLMQHEQQIETRIEAPKPVWTDFETISYSTLHHDVLVYIFSYIGTTRDLQNAGLACTTWQQASECNVLWKQSFDRYVLEKNIPAELSNSNSLRATLLLLSKRHAMSIGYMYNMSVVNSWGWYPMYALIALVVCLLVGLTYLSVIVPLILDGKVRMTTQNLFYVSIPSWLLLVLPVITILPALGSALAILRSVYAYLYRFVQQWNFSFVEVPPFISQWSLFRIIVGWFGYIPIVFICSQIRLWFYASDANTVFAYRISFLPIYVFTLIFIVCDIAVLFNNRKSAIIRLDVIFFFTFLFINGLVVLQSGLVSGKMDNAILAPWTVILIPIWTVYALFLAAMFLSPLLIWYAFVHNRARYGDAVNTFKFLLFVNIMTSPLLIWLILFALRLDLVLTSQFVYAFIPIYLFVAFWIMIAVCSLGLVLCFYKIIGY